MAHLVNFRLHFIDDFSHQLEIIVTIDFSELDRNLGLKHCAKVYIMEIDELMDPFVAYVNGRFENPQVFHRLKDTPFDNSDDLIIRHTWDIFTPPVNSKVLTWKYHIPKSHLKYQAKDEGDYDVSEPTVKFEFAALVILTNELNGIAYHYQPGPSHEVRLSELR